jgi:alkylhydroperoxidase family enzyme
MRIRTIVALAAALVCAAAHAEAPVKEAAKSTAIPLLSDQEVGPPELVEAIRKRRPNGKLLALDRMLLHSPSFAKGWNAMFGAIRGQLALPARLRETAILAIAVLNRAEYEWTQHEAEFVATGGSKEQLAALRDVERAARDEKNFGEAERATLQLTIEMTRTVQVAPATMARVRAALPDKEVVELVGTIAGYNMVSRFLVATGVERD